MSSDVARLLNSLRKGHRPAADELFPLVMGELRSQGIAASSPRAPRAHLAGHGPWAYMRLVRQDEAQWQDRAHFLAVAAQAMRFILVAHSRQRKTAKRGGARDGSPLDSALLVMYETSVSVDVEALNAALSELSAIRPRAAQVVDMRFLDRGSSRQLPHSQCKPDSLM